MDKSFKRKIEILDCLTPYPKKLEVNELCEKLINSEWFAIKSDQSNAISGRYDPSEKRKIQRYLDDLEDMGFVKSEGGKPKGWFLASITWQNKINDPLVSSMEKEVAFSFQMINLFLKKHIPNSLLSSLNIYIAQGKKKLQNKSNRSLNDWTTKVAAVTHSQPLIAPDIDSNVMSIIYEALLSEKKLKLSYRPKFKELKTYFINPLGIVLSDQVIYLIGSLVNTEKIRQFAFHRFIKAEISDEAVQAKTSFSLKKYIDDGNLLLPSSEKNSTIKIVLKANKWVTAHLEEAKLAEKQVITKITNDSKYHLITAHVKNTKQLRWWILGLGSNLEVLKPIQLRDEIKNSIIKMNKMYKRKDF